MGTLLAAANQCDLSEVSGIIGGYVLDNNSTIMAVAGDDVANMNDVIGMGYSTLTGAESIRLTYRTLGRNYNAIFSPISGFPFGGIF